MSKKNKLRKKKYRLSKHEFIDKICNECRLCQPPVKPEFCYEDAYKGSSRGSIDMILEQLPDIKRWVTNSGYPNIRECPDEYIQYILQTVFCSSNFCGQLPRNKQECKHLVSCVSVFRKQVKGIANNLIIFNNKCNNILGNNNNIFDLNDYKNKKKKKKEKFVANILTPTFFCNEGFKKEIKEILGGDNYREQDTVEESTRHTETPSG